MPKAKRPKSARVLFIGNSFTQRNRLPDLIADMAAERGMRIEHELISAGGTSLRGHWNAGRATAAIQTGRFEYVVLQEQSTLPVKNATRMADNVRLFDEVIRAAKSKTVLYMTWAREYCPDHQKLIADAYKFVANRFGAALVPAGVAWHKFVALHDSPALYDSDQSHPSPAGSYLVACVFLATLLDLSPIGVQSGTRGLEPADAATIQRFVGKQFGRSGKKSPGWS